MKITKLLDNLHQWTHRQIGELFPRFSLYYFHKPRAFFFRRSHPVHGFLKGKSNTTGSRHPSCLFFSVHKSASTFMSSFLAKLAKESNLTPIDYNSYFVSQGQGGLRKQQDAAMLAKVFYEKGFLYGPLRYFLPVQNLHDYRVVLFLRDPRDVLTSQYFSLKKTHPLLTAQMIKKRRNANRVSVDKHVIQQAERFYTTYTQYCERLLTLPNVLLLRYEDMIIDFPGFLRSVNDHFELGLAQEQLKKLDQSNEFLPAPENQSQHKRIVRAGDHRNKLAPETIHWLNEKFRPILKQLGYNEN